jgi:pimeloyl-ACP methyl ester carboxylesterase
MSWLPVRPWPRRTGSRSPPASTRIEPRQTIALIEGLNAAPAVIIGYSAGAIIALELALRRPEVLSGIVLLDPAFNLKQHDTGLPHHLRNGPDLAADWPAPGGSGELAALRLQLLHRGLGLRHEDSAGATGEVADERRRDLCRLRAPAAAASTRAGASISVPITLVKLSPPFLRRSCQRLKELLPQARGRTNEHSGHWAGLDAPEESLSILREPIQAAPRG